MTANSPRQLLHHKTEKIEREREKIERVSTNTHTCSFLQDFYVEGGERREEEIKKKVCFLLIHSVLTWGGGGNYIKLQYIINYEMHSIE